MLRDTGEGVWQHTGPLTALRAPCCSLPRWAGTISHFGPPPGLRPPGLPSARAAGNRPRGAAGGSGNPPGSLQSSSLPSGSACVTHHAGVHDQRRGGAPLHTGIPDRSFVPSSPASLAWRRERDEGRP